jgi:hypothetical protein
MVAMNKQEAIQLLALIKVAYPTAYKDMDNDSKQATVNMWASSFPDVPYPIMEQAFNHFRMQSKFPPTVAEMVDELKGIHYRATELAMIHRNLGNADEVKQYMAIMECTYRYKNNDHLGLQLSSIPVLHIGGDSYATTPRDRLDSKDRLPILDAGEGGV